MSKERPISNHSKFIALAAILGFALGLLTIQHEYELRKRATDKLRYSVDLLHETATKHFPELRFGQVNHLAELLFKDHEVEEVIVQRSGLKSYVRLNKNSQVTATRRLSLTKDVIHNGKKIATSKW